MGSHPEFKNLAELIHWRVAETPDKDAFYAPDGEDWRTYSWSEVGDRVSAIAAGLRAIGIEDEARVGILASTRVEWIFCDMGILCAGGATSTIYPSNTPEECAYIIIDSGTVALFAENDDQVAKILETRDTVPGLVTVINLDGHGSEDGFVITLSQLEEKGRAWLADNAKGLVEVAERLDASMLATLIYTSGTTGMPKGVELLHDCWLYTGKAMHDLGFLTPSDKQYLWLPMSHSFGKVLETALIYTGIPTAIDGRIDRIVANLSVLEPTFMAAAPRIFEKVYNKVVTGAQEGGGIKFGIFRWSIGVGQAASKVRQAGGEPSGFLALKYKIADKLVFSKLRSIFGGKIRFFISGSAPLSREMAEFFHAANMLILEGYGLTESSAASFVNRPDKYAFGTVGQALPGTEVKLDPADGEILMKSRGIMRGYYNQPEKTAETLTEDGWLRTGDIGEITKAGMLKITDRKKDLIKTSGGKYVAPQNLEGSLKALSPFISQVLVHGNKRNYCTALITLDADSIQGWADDNGLADRSYAEISTDPRAHALIEPFIEKLNENLARYETIKKFALLPVDFSIETGELTPSMKVKRKVVESKYMDTLDAFYKGAMAEI
jgi:long-chain acyl-CoA synthetase